MNEAKVEIIEAKPKRITRTISMISSMAGQRTTIGFFLIFVGLLLIFGVLCFSSFENDDTSISDNSLSDFKNENEQKSLNKKFEQKKKISLKKQIFIAINVDKLHISDIATSIRAWVSDWEKNEHNGGIHFVSDVPINTDPFQSTIVQTAFLHDKIQKEALKFIKSLEAYSLSSRAFWYMQIPVSSFLNIKAIEQVTDYLNTLDPLNDLYKFTISFNNTDHSNSIFILSRAAMRKAVENKESSPDIFKTLDIEKYFINQPFSKKSIEILKNEDIKHIPKCEKGVKKTKNSEIFGVLSSQTFLKNNWNYKTIFDDENIYLTKKNGEIEICT